MWQILITVIGSPFVSKKFNCFRNVLNGVVYMTFIILVFFYMDKQAGGLETCLEQNR